MAQKGTMLHHIRDERRKSSEHTRIAQRSSTQKNHLIERSRREIYQLLRAQRKRQSQKGPARNIILGPRGNYQATNEHQCMDEIMLIKNAKYTQRQRQLTETYWQGWYVDNEYLLPVDAGKLSILLRFQRRKTNTNRNGESKTTYF